MSLKHSTIQTITLVFPYFFLVKLNASIIYILHIMLLNMYNAQSVVVKYDDIKVLVRHNLFVRIMCTLGSIKVLLMVLKIFFRNPYI